MNKILLDNLLKGYLTNIRKNIEWEFQGHYIEIYDFRDSCFWRRKMKLNEFCEIWYNFTQSNKLSDSDIIYSINYFLKNFSHIERTLKKTVEKLKVENKEKIFRGDFRFDSSNLNSYKNFFISELDNLTNTKFKETESNEVIIKPTDNGISWENKTELCQLILVLARSKKIFKNGKPILQKDLIDLFSKTFNIEKLNFHDLVMGSVKTNKVTYDGKTFISELNKLMNDYRTEILDKEK